MGNRLSQIATRTGDDGTTGLGDGTRVDKDHVRIGALGDVDELNSIIGLLRPSSCPRTCEPTCSTSSTICSISAVSWRIPGYTMIEEKQVERLDTRLAHYNANLPRLAEFILPGGSRAAAVAHVCRTVCRRAERALVALGKQDKVNDGRAAIPEPTVRPDVRAGACP